MFFTFSERPDTDAIRLPGKVSQGEKDSRSKKLSDLSDKKSLEFQTLNIGQETSVLFEKNRNEGFITGLTSNYIRAEYPWQKKLACQIKKVRLTGISQTGKMSVELIN